MPIWRLLGNKILNVMWHFENEFVALLWPFVVLEVNPNELT